MVKALALVVANLLASLAANLLVNLAVTLVVVMIIITSIINAANTINVKNIVVNAIQYNNLAVVLKIIVLHYLIGSAVNINTTPLGYFTLGVLLFKHYFLGIQLFTNSSFLFIHSFATSKGSLSLFCISPIRPANCVSSILKFLKNSATSGISFSKSFLAIV